MLRRSLFISMLLAGATGQAADVPAGDSWCIASESTIGQSTDSVVTTWQVFGQDDPRFQ